MKRREGTGEGDLNRGGRSEALIGKRSAKLNREGFRRVVASLVLRTSDGGDEDRPF